MANADSKNKLKMVIGGVKYELPLYDSYDGFYNKKYMKILLSDGNTRYIGLTPDRSDITVNAGCYINDKKYYFLIKEIESNAINASGSFYQYIANSQSFQFQKIISTTAYAPEAGQYRVVFKVKWAGSYNDYKNYRDCSYYRFAVKQGETELADTGEHNLQDSIFYPYSTGKSDETGMANVAQWFTIDEKVMSLSAGSNVFDLWAGMRFTSNKHAALYVSPFQVEITYLNSDLSIDFYDSGTFKCPEDVNKVTVTMYGGGGGGGGAVFYKLKRIGNHSTSNSYRSTSNDGSDGEYMKKEITVTPNTSYPVIVGKGGAGSTDNVQIEISNYTNTTSGMSFTAGDGSDGGDTTAFGMTASGGKGGYGGIFTWTSSDREYKFTTRPPTTTEAENGGKGATYATKEGILGTTYSGTKEAATSGKDGFIRIEYSK